MKTCRKCGSDYSGDKCPDCVADRGSNALPPPPKTCMVVGCNNDTAVASLQLEDERFQPLFPVLAAKYTHERAGRHYLTSGYKFVRHITRCAECFLREHARFDWRDAMVKDTLAKHPTIKAANYADETDRMDVFSMIGAFARRAKVPEPIKEDPFVEEILTGHVVTPEIVATVDVTKYLRV